MLLLNAKLSKIENLDSILEDEEAKKNVIDRIIKIKNETNIKEVNKK